MARTKHSKKDVEKVLKDAEKVGWLVCEIHKGHRWGTIDCGSGCSRAIYSTPKNPTNHAKALRRGIAQCPHDVQES